MWSFVTPSLGLPTASDWPGILGLGPAHALIMIATRLAARLEHRYLALFLRLNRQRQGCSGRLPASRKDRSPHGPS
eukprot:2378556-Amphidinium_carterae.2